MAALCGSVPYNSQAEQPVARASQLPARKPTAHPDDKIREVLQQASSTAGSVGWQIRVGSGRQDWA